jgi:hypothetical protein
MNLLPVLKSRWLIYPCLLVLLYPLAKVAAYSLMEMNGFNLDKPLIPKEQILSGGPPRDGIPSIDEPNFIEAKEANLQARDKVLGVSFNGQTKAYPIRILNYHELVNDTFKQHPVTVSFCPLCGTGIVFDGKVKTGKTRTFGVSGLLYNSDLLMYDRETDSLWSQIEGRAVTGPEKGTQLERIPVEHTIWADWHNRHPNTLVLSEETGHWRNYQRTPYPGYEHSDRTYFPVNHKDSRYPPKTQVIGLEVKGQYKAYPFTELKKLSQTYVIDHVNGQKVKVIFNADANSARIEDMSGQVLPSLTAFWFAWIAFHPDSEVFNHSMKQEN